jgi:tetratricopeptide (TPR) repeat protein
MARKFERVLAGAALIVTAILPVPPVLAQTQQQLHRCLNNIEAFSLGLRIDGCTALIQSGRLAGENLSLAYYNRGIAYFKKSQYDRAITDFDQAIQLDPNSTFALNNRGTAYARKGQYDRAIADFNQAIRLNTNYAITYINRGSAFAKKGQYDRAIEDFDQAIRLDPNDASAIANRKMAMQLNSNSAVAVPGIASARNNRSLADQTKSNSPNADSVNASALGKEDPEKQLQRKAASADSKVAVASRSRSASRLKSKIRHSSVRSHRTKPQSAIARFFQKQQRNIRNAFRSPSRWKIF